MHTVKEITPTRIPYKCPVCNGFGTVTFKKVTCHGCHGKGYVLIDNDDRLTDYENTHHPHESMD